MDESRLLPVRCPGMVMDKSKGELTKCNKLCVKVYPGSSGEIHSQPSKLEFETHIPITYYICNITYVILHINMYYIFKHILHTHRLMYACICVKSSAVL